MGYKKYLGIVLILFVKLAVVANSAFGAWGTATVDSTGNTGQYTSIAVGTSGAVYISYYDVSNTALMYATTALPTVTTGAASNVTTDSATLAGTVNGNGLSSTAMFSYGVASGAYTGTSTTQSMSATGTTTVSIGISSLSAGTMYYYRLAANHSSGTSTGNEASFSTSSSGGGGGGGGGGGVTEELTISSTSPSNDATGLSVTTAVSATFNMYVNGNTVTTDSFTLSDEYGTVSGSVVTNGATITFTPSLALSYGTEYTGTVTTRVQAANFAGTTMESNYTWSFTTESLTTVTPTPASTPSPTVTTVPTLPPPPTLPPLPTPTVSILPTPQPTATTTPPPTECVPESMTISSYKLNLKMKSSKKVTVIVTGSDGCLVEGDIVEAKIDKSGKKYVAVSPKRATTDANGQARFKIRAKGRKGDATVSFTSEEIEETITVKVAK